MKGWDDGTFAKTLIFKRKSEGYRVHFLKYFQFLGKNWNIYFWFYLNLFIQKDIVGLKTTGVWWVL